MIERGGFVPEILPPKVVRKTIAEQRKLRHPEYFRRLSINFVKDLNIETT
jgi:hypothetical protein